MSRAAQDLFDAATDRRTLASLSSARPELSVPTGYRIQDELIGLHEAAGSTVVGAKLGLTSKAKQEQMGIADPIRGWLMDFMVLGAGESFDVASLGQPRAEPEIAVTLGRDVSTADGEPARALEAVESVHAAIEVLDSRYAGYKFTLPDVVADNSSGGRFIIGPPIPLSAVPDLGLLGCVFGIDGAVRATASGAATMGHPAVALAWLVRELATHPRGLRAGDVILTGGLTAVEQLRTGSTVTAEFDRLGSLSLVCR